MKHSEIVAGADYAYTNQRRYAYPGGLGLSRIRIIDPAKLYGRTRYGGKVETLEEIRAGGYRRKTPSPAMLAAFVLHNGKTGAELAPSTTDVVCTWAEHEAALAASKIADEKSAAWKAETANRQQMARDRAEAMGIRTQSGRWDMEIVLEIDVLEAVLDRLAAAEAAVIFRGGANR